jgi:UDP-N-acetylglucosamine diphosphorylase/glucosamine-1-phosphate N-acetyltransferase
MDSRLAVVIMAAGKGTRMKDPGKAKVMNEIDGKPLIGHVAELAKHLDAVRVVVVVGWQKDSVISYLAELDPGIRCVEQSPQLGTGHAVMQAEASLDGFDGEVLVLSGDVPMLRKTTAGGLVDEHRKSGADVTVLTARLDDATGYGRIVRNKSGAVTGIVEEKDASAQERAIREINSGIYVFDKAKLFEGLKHIKPENAQREYYLTDILGYFWRNGGSVRAAVAADPREILGINTVEQLEEARARKE